MTMVHRKLRILLGHTRYQEAGGEDYTIQAERELLAGAGHEVIEYIRDNAETTDYSVWQKVTLVPRTTWAWDSYSQLEQLLEKARPDIAHFHNIFPLLSPAVYYACRRAGVPVVQTLHNYRLFCPAATFFRDGHVCEECVDHSLLRGVRYGCYRSRGVTTVLALALAFHRRRRTFSDLVDCYVTPTDFTRQKCITSGLPAHKVVVKPNFVHPDRKLRKGVGKHVLFVGRISPEKGLRTLLLAWRHLKEPVPLRIVGKGPLKSLMQEESDRCGLSTVSFEGEQSPEEVALLTQQSRFLVFPSEAYETFGRAIVEAYACGVPVIGSRLGAMAELIDEGRTGLMFRPGDAADLAQKVAWAWRQTASCNEMGRRARAEYEAKYTGERNYQKLIKIYQRVCQLAASPPR